MASAFEKRPGQFHAKFKDRNGIWREIATNERTLKAARAFAQEKERTEQRIRAGIEPDQGEAADQTFGWLAQWWIDTFAGKLRSNSFATYLSKYAIPELGMVPLRSLRPDQIETFLGWLEDNGGHSPKTLNDVRACLNRVFVLGKARGKWRGANPVEMVDRRKVPKPPPPPVLRVREVPAFLDAAGEWRPLMATAVWMALRRGEIFALRKQDADLAERTMVIGRSHEADTTKGDHSDVLPIPEPLVPYLEEAIRVSPSELVFPDRNGKMRSRDTDMKGVVRRILVAAGLVESYELRCFRRNCGHTEMAKDAAQKSCPKCGRALWAKSIPRDLGFHGLRHSSATLLLKAKVPHTIVQKILRHSDVRVTVGTYGHLDLDDMRMAMDELAERTAPAPTVQPVLSSPPSASPFGAYLVPDDEEPKGAGLPTAANSARLNTNSNGPSRIRTWDQPVMSGGPGLSDSVAPLPIPSQPLGGEGRPANESTPCQAVRRSAWSAGGPSGPVGVAPGDGRLLTVREVAERLAVSTFTVYGLCERGELPHIRLSNAIRIARADLAAFLAGQRAGGG